MAETDLKITVTVSNIVTLDDARKALKELNKELGATATANIPRQKELGAEIVRVKNIIADATAGTVTANGKMMKSYFTLGEELRRYYMQQRVGNRTLNEVSRTASEFGTMLGMGGIGGIVGNATQQFQQMEFAVTGLGLASQRGTGLVASLGSKLMGLATPLAIVVTGVGLVIMAMKEAAKITKELNESFEKEIQLLIQLGRISAGTELAMLEKRLAAIKKEMPEPSFWAALFGPTALMEDFLKRGVDIRIKEHEIGLRTKKLHEDMAKADWDRFLAEVAILDKEKERLKIEIAKTNEIFKQLQITISGESIKPERIFKGRLGMRRPERPSGFLGEEKTPGMVLKEANEDAQMFANTMQSAFSQATNTLAEGFSRAFGLADNLAGNFLATIMSGIAQMLAMKAAGGLMDLLGLGVTIAGAVATGGTSLIPTAIFGGARTITARAGGGWLNEPIVGMGMKSKGLYTLAERESEYVSNMNQMGQAGRYGGGGDNAATIVKALQSIQWRLQGLDIVAVYDRNLPVRLARNW